VCERRVARRRGARARRSVRVNPIPNPDPDPNQAPQMSLIEKAGGKQREKEKKQTLYAPHKGKRNSVTIIGWFGFNVFYIGSAGGIVISVGIGIGITVTANCVRPEFDVEAR
jgi:hypothetical protein